MPGISYEDIPNGTDDAIAHLEAGLGDDTAAWEGADPGPLAPMGAQIFHGFLANRIEADRRYLDEVRESDRAALEHVAALKAEVAKDKQ